MPDQVKIQCDPEPRAGWNMCERAQARRSTVSGRSQQPGAIPRLDAPTTGEVIARVPQHMSSSRQTAAPHARGHAQHVWECIAGHMVGPKASRKGTRAGQIGSPAMRGWSPIVVWPASNRLQRRKIAQSEGFPGSRDACCGWHPPGFHLHAEDSRRCRTMLDKFPRTAGEMTAVH